MNGALLILKKDCNIMNNSNFKLSSALSVSCFCAVINLVNASTGADDDQGNIKFHQRNTAVVVNRIAENNGKIPPIDFNKLSVVELGHLIMDPLFKAAISGEFKSTKTIEKHDEFGKIVSQKSSSIDIKYASNKTNTYTKTVQIDPGLSISCSQNNEKNSAEGIHSEGRGGSIKIGNAELAILMGIGCKGIRFILKHAP